MDSACLKLFSLKNSSIQLPEWGIWVEASNVAIQETTIGSPFILSGRFEVILQKL
jgi:hypothetical protein